MAGDRDVVVLGAGMHPWGKWGRDFTEYGVAAAEAALDDGGHDEERQQRPHAVVGKPLPHLGEKESGKPPRLARKNSAARCGSAIRGYRHRWHFAPRICSWFNNIPQSAVRRQAILLGANG